MDVEWRANSLVVTPTGDGERMVLESVVDSLFGLKATNLNYRSKSGPVCDIDSVDDHSVSIDVDKPLEVAHKVLR